jgi:hypothetical protein
MDAGQQELYPLLFFWAHRGFEKGVLWGLWFYAAPSRGPEKGIPWGLGLFSRDVVAGKPCRGICSISLRLVLGADPATAWFLGTHYFCRVLCSGQRIRKRR